ncbi:hypothetical protein AA0112_g626 [Alternaria arborescens]|nr:hypothetical protein AA0112_g626 [Alternaria arborescens]
MERGDIFSSQQDRSIRKALLENVCTFPGVIPSLRTFFETLKYLEPLCEALRQLLGEQMKSTIRSSLTGLFFGSNKNMVQLNETEDVEIRIALSQQDAMMVAYTELWAFCSRHFDGLTASTPRKETGESKPLVKGPNPVVWQHLARFALSRGFRISYAQQITTKQKYHHAQLAIDYLRKAKPMCSNFSDDHIQRVVTAVESEESYDIPESTRGSTRLNLDRRNGRPFEHDFAEEKRIMFFPQLYSGPPCENADLRLMRRDLFSCMFISMSLQQADFGLTTNAQVFDEDPMDLEPLVSSPELDKYAELQSRYAKLEQRLRNENEDLKDQLQRCSSEYRRVKDELDRFNQGTWVAMHELEMERAESSDLRLKCAQLRRELEASKNSATQIIPRIVELPEPLAIESTTMPVLEDSDEEVLDVPPLSDWKERTGKGYEIFVVDHTSEQVLKGYSFDISSSRGEAVSRISDALHQAASIAEGKEYHVATVLGKRIVNTDPEFLFGTIETCQTLAIGTEKGIENWNSTLNKAAPSSLSYLSTITI